MKRLFALLATLCAVWVLWSGHFSGFLLAMGGLSCLFVCWISKRMGLLDHDGVPIELRLRQSLGYVVWLTREVVLANISVVKILLRRQLVIRRAIFDIPTSPQTNVGKVIMANSITLTPGTVTTKVQEGSMQVHALVDPGLNDPTIRAIDTRVRGLEGIDV